MKTKQCFKCEEQKPVIQFYKHSGMADGFLNKCKSCTKDDVHINRIKHIDKYRAYDRERKFHGHPETSVKWRIKNSSRYRARTYLNNAIRDGRAIKGRCAVCNNEKVFALQSNYSRPLSVRWLCPIHHYEHRNRKKS